MRLKMTLVLTAILGVALLAPRVSAEEPVVLKTQKEKVGYTIGVDVVRNFKRQGIEVDLDLVIKGMRDGLAGGRFLMTDDDLRKTMAEFQAGLRLKQRQTRKVATEDNKKKGEAFLAENKTREGVVTLPSGLQ